MQNLFEELYGRVQKFSGDDIKLENVFNDHIEYSCEAMCAVIVDLFRNEYTWRV